MRPTRSFFAWLDNFWYHYKWHTIAALFLIIVAVVITIQFCERKEEADFPVLYAGDYDMWAHPTTAKDLASSLSVVADNMDDESKTADVFYYYLKSSPDGNGIPSADVQNAQAFRAELDNVTTYVYLFSEAVFTDRTAVADGTRYVTPVAPYLPADTSSVRVTEDGCGVYLHSLPIASMPGFSALPEDTVLCLRVSFSVTTMFDQEEALARYAEFESFFRALLSYVPTE